MGELLPGVNSPEDVKKLNDKELDKLADIVRNSIDVEAIYKIMGLKK